MTLKNCRFRPKNILRQKMIVAWAFK
jgi:hypothetical protein